MRRSTHANIRILSKEILPKVASEDDEMNQITGELEIARNALIQVTTRLKANFFEREGHCQHFQLLFLIFILPEMFQKGQTLATGIPKGMCKDILPIMLDTIIKVMCHIQTIMQTMAVRREVDPPMEAMGITLQVALGVLGNKLQTNSVHIPSLSLLFVFLVIRWKATYISLQMLVAFYVTNHDVCFLFTSIKSLIYNISSYF